MQLTVLISKTTIMHTVSVREIRVTVLELAIYTFLWVCNLLCMKDFNCCDRPRWAAFYPECDR